MKRIYIKMLNPLYLLFLVFIASLFSVRPVELNVQRPMHVQEVSVMQSANVWQEWCEYSWQDGTSSKKFLYSIDVTTLSPGEIINTRALQECQS